MQFAKVFRILPRILWNSSSVETLVTLFVTQGICVVWKSFSFEVHQHHQN
jgi:hypothetical protein